MELANGKKNKFFTPQGEGENRYFVEDLKIETAEVNHNVSILSPFIPAGGKMLDVACAQGRFGQIFKQKGCLAYGVDIDKKALEIAKGTKDYEALCLADISNPAEPDLNRFLLDNGPFDGVLFSDIFEHLVDPTATLIAYLNYLKPNSVILVSVPNVANIDISLNLLNGVFNYTDMGILDNTHLKYFTKNSFAQWIAQINENLQDKTLDCEYVGATFYESDFVQMVKEKYPELYRITGQYENHSALQILFCIKVGEKESSTPKLKALLEETTVDVVDILGSALAGKEVNLPPEAPIKGETYQLRVEIENQKKHNKGMEESLDWHKNYEKKMQESISWHEAHTKELEESIDWYKNHTQTLTKNLDDNIKYISDLTASNQWYAENFKVSQQSLMLINDRIHEFEESIQWHENYESIMQAKINELEQEKQGIQNELTAVYNSRSWRMTKIFRKKKR